MTAAVLDYNHRPDYRAWLWTLAAVALFVDQATKYGVFAWLRLHESVTAIPNVLYLTHNQLNQGAVFGLGNDHGHLSNYAFAGFSMIAIVFIVLWTRRAELRKDRLLMVALGLILGGAAGNLYDRLVFAGVRDFIWVHIERWGFDFAVFNVADSSLVVGACLLFLHTLLKPAHEPAKPDALPGAVAV